LERCLARDSATTADLAPDIARRLSEVIDIAKALAYVCDHLPVADADPYLQKMTEVLMRSNVN
jgi:hypothetical protein